MSLLVFDGTSLLYVATIFLLMIIIAVIFTQRQILRLRHNAARIKPHVSLDARMLHKKTKTMRQCQLDNVDRLCREYHPRLTDCVAMNTHGKRSYVPRMIAVDDITIELDFQLRHMEGLSRKAGESTLCYLKRLRERDLNSISSSLVHEIAFLEECARFRSNKFGVEEMMRLRSLICTFMSKLLATFPKQVVENKALSSSGNSALPHRHTRTSRFGGSDGGRLIARENEERRRLIPSNEPSSHVRRNSHSHFT
ncbi:unnamed protein product [Caenorhabditis auriculariae]|uniref:Uncharacterized protein n=1 Tax=Caenorhabditis auriculariae TaxID=2777116 RepID=A0A8S1GTT2_9PELO|nr:unnamed protein product [Caenorhabditis auriculariae]